MKRGSDEIDFEELDDICSSFVNQVTLSHKKRKLNGVKSKSGAEFDYDSYEKALIAKHGCDEKSDSELLEHMSEVSADLRETDYETANEDLFYQFSIGNYQVVSNLVVYLTDHVGVPKDVAISFKNGTADLDTTKRIAGYLESADLEIKYDDGDAGNYDEPRASAETRLCIEFSDFDESMSDEAETVFDTDGVDRYEMLSSATVDDVFEPSSNPLLPRRWEIDEIIVDCGGKLCWILDIVGEIEEYVEPRDMAVLNRELYEVAKRFATDPTITSIGRGQYNDLETVFETVFDLDNLPLVNGRRPVTATDFHQLIRENNIAGPPTRQYNVGSFRRFKELLYLYGFVGFWDENNEFPASVKCDGFVDFDLLIDELEEIYESEQRGPDEEGDCLLDQLTRITNDTSIEPVIEEKLLDLVGPDTLADLCEHPVSYDSSGAIVTNSVLNFHTTPDEFKRRVKNILESEEVVGILPENYLQEDHLIQKIRQEQRSVSEIIPSEVIRCLVTDWIGSHHEIAWTDEAIEVLREAAEYKLVDVFTIAMRIASGNRRDKVSREDFFLASHHFTSPNGTEMFHNQP